MGAGVEVMMCVEEVIIDDLMQPNFYYVTVTCPSLTDPSNGMITCSLGDDGIPSYEDICSFTCNTGYELTGSDTSTCLSDGSWSSRDDVCRRGIESLIIFIIVLKVTTFH